jgi:pSer/pThr/pTyr-binding forkhead associated (FHA) protein
MKAKLLVTKGETHVREVNLKPTTTLGRGKDCDVCISSSLVSRDHCVISEDQGTLRVKDLGSTNGTFVNDQAVTDQVLRPGDKLTIGPLSFVVQYEPPPGALAAASTDQDLSPVMDILDDDSGTGVATELIDAEVVDDDDEEVIEAVAVDIMEGDDEEVVEAIPVEEEKGSSARRRPPPVADDDDDERLGDFLSRLQGDK